MLYDLNIYSRFFFLSKSKEDFENVEVISTQTAFLLADLADQTQVKFDFAVLYLFFSSIQI